jgi:hypothetical protein
MLAAKAAINDSLNYGVSVGAVSVEMEMSICCRATSNPDCQDEQMRQLTLSK